MDKLNGSLGSALEEIESTALAPSGPDSAYIQDECGGDVAFVMRLTHAGEAYKQRLVASFNACQGVDIHQLCALGPGGVTRMLDCMAELASRARAANGNPQGIAAHTGSEAAPRPRTLRANDTAGMRGELRLVDGTPGQNEGLSGSAHRRSTRVVNVVAWRHKNGSGFQWYEDADDANEAFASEQRNCEDMREALWQAWRFEATVDSRWPHAQVTTMIESNLDQLCAAAEEHCSYREGRQQRATR